MENVYENVRKELSTETIIEILKQMLEKLKNAENSRRIQIAKDEAGNDMVQHMRLVFPIIVDCQVEAIGQVGLGQGREGLKEFLQRVNCLLSQNEQVNRLFLEMKHIYLPPP